jgi:hypothetical protein
MFDIIKDESFDIDNTIQYILSIQVSLDGFCFLIIHPSENKIVAFKSTPLKISSENLLARRLKEWFESEELLKKSYETIRVFIFAENFTIVPEELSEIELFENLNPVLFQHDSNFNIVQNKIGVLNAQLIFLLPADLGDVFYQYFKNQFEIIHPATKFLQSPIESKSRNSAVIIYTKKFFYLIIYRDNNLLLANSFRAAHPNDLVYNVLNTFHQLEIARSETDLYFADSDVQSTKPEEVLKPYFTNILYLKNKGMITNPETMNQSLQLYLTLI